MTAAAKRLNLADLPASVRSKLAKEQGIRKPRVQRFSKDAVREHAFKVLAVIAHLSQDERRRVLAHAASVNGV
jgi:hypothetical protein